MGNIQSNTITPEPKLTFPKFDHNTELLQTQIAQVEKSKAILSKGNWLAGKLPPPESQVAGFIIKILDFLVFQNKLQEALINTKIEDSVANQAGVQVKSEIRSIQSSITILNGQITREERTAEVRIAENRCRNVLNLFDDTSGCFSKRPLESSAVLFLFSSIYIEIGKGYFQLDPSPVIIQHLLNVAKQLQRTLKDYKLRAIEQRMLGIKSKSSSYAVGGAAGISYDFDDEYRADFKRYHGEFMSNGFHEKVADYKKKVEELYEDYFNNFILVADEFVHMLESGPRNV